MGMGGKSARHSGVAPAGNKVVISMFLSSSTSFSEMESFSSEEFSTESLSDDSSSPEES